MTLEVKNLVKRFGTVTAVNSFSFSVKRGEVLGLLGRNGAGKTTTIKMLLQLHEPTEGTITWDGKPLNRNTVSIGYLPEERGLHAKSTILNQLRLFGELEGMNRKAIDESITYWLKKLEVEHYRNKKASELSKGNQQKIQFIAAVLHDPELIILDEPFSGLDPVNVTLFSEAIQELVNRGKTIILSSHRMESVEEFCDCICILKDGNVVTSGYLREVKSRYGYQTLSFSYSQQLEAVLKQRHYVFVCDHNEIHLRIHDEDEILNILRYVKEEGVSLRNFKVLEPTLHEIFVESAS